MSLLTSAFDLPDRLSAKSDPALIGTDEQHFSHLAATLEQTIGELAERLDEVRKAPAGSGQRALDRDQEVHRLTSRLRTLRRFGLDLCLGRMVPAREPVDTGPADQDGAEPVYIGRLGLTDPSGRRLLVDWRSPAAEPFFAATHANPMGLASRRRYRWASRTASSGARITDYWDEVFTTDGLVGHAALDDQSAFIATLSESRSDRMRDVLGTIQADQDAIIRAGSRGTLVVDGGPGTGKTVVALHRAAYLLYADPRLGHHRGDVLVVGPHQPYLNYVGNVLPSLGEEGVKTCTLRDLVPEGAHAAPEPDPEAARLKSSAAMVSAIEPAVRLYEEPPETGTAVETPWGEFWLSAEDWVEAFEAVEPGTPHNEAPEQILEALAGRLTERLEDDATVDGDGVPAETPTAEQVRRAVERDRHVRNTLTRSWPPLEPTDLVGDLWSVPAYLRRCAPHLSADQVRALQRDDAQAWTLSDLPLLDAARLRLGDPEAARLRQRRRATVAGERERMSAVVDDLIATDDSEMLVMSMLRGEDLRQALDDDAVLPRVGVDLLAGPFAHVIVDEAQELTDAEWQMLLQRCPSRSFTVVGDRAQARHGFGESWPERLERVGLGRPGLDQITVASLTVNYRTPAEVMAEAEPVIRAVLPDANVPISIRDGDGHVVHGPASQLGAILENWLAANAEGVACVIGAPAFLAGFRAPDRVRSLTPELSKGLEFDLVVVVDPQTFGDGVQGAVDRYVAMTRATRQLAVLTRG